MIPSQIIFATANPHKIEEVSRINRSIRFLSLSDVGIQEDIPETGRTFKENALQKAMYVYSRKRIPTLSEDSGLVIEELKGEPGVLSARYAGEEKDHEKNIQKVLDLLAGVSNRSAYFASTLCYIDDNGHINYFEGRCYGKIHSQISGDGGFGYDPIFIPEGYNDTFGNLSDDIKDRISHRKKSFEQFAQFILK